jgi:hypothetical protein
LIEPLRVRAAKALLTDSAFAALTRNGSIKVWGNPNSGGKKAPRGRGYTKIYSTSSAFAALKSDGSIKVEPLRVRAAKALSVE